jgi:hypothetical protein
MYPFPIIEGVHFVYMFLGGVGLISLSGRTLAHLGANKYSLDNTETTHALF